MRRLARHLFTLCSAASLLLCVAVCVLWWRSVITPSSFELWTWPVDGTVAREGYTARSERGLLEVYKVSVTSFRFSSGSLVVYDPSVDRVVRIPYWAIGASCLAVASLSWWLQRRWRGRVARGLCETCGYDLRASPERCPECGTLASA